MWRVVWTEPALDDLDGIQAYIDKFNPKAAPLVAAQLIDAGNSLTEYPNRGRALGDVRELLSVYPYAIKFRVQTDVVQILRVRHGAQRPERN